MTEYLRTMSLRSRRRPNGHGGLEKFHAGTFDLVLTNRAMPDTSGDQMAAAIKKRRPAYKPIILVTVFSDMMISADEAPTSPDLVVAKPNTRPDLR